MANKGCQGFLSATNTRPRPGRFPLLCAVQSGGRAMPVARGQRRKRVWGQVVYRADGSVAEARGLAVAIRVARLRVLGGEFYRFAPGNLDCGIGADFWLRSYPVYTEVTRRATTADQSCHKGH
jgi:hypothetical protein